MLPRIAFREGHILTRFEAPDRSSRQPSRQGGTVSWKRFIPVSTGAEPAMLIMVVSFGSPGRRARRHGPQKYVDEKYQRANSEAEKHTGDECVPVAHRDVVVGYTTC